MAAAVISNQPPEGSDKIEELKKEIFDKAEKIIHKTFPENIVKLRQLLQSDLWQERNYDVIMGHIPPVSDLQLTLSNSTVGEKGNNRISNGSVASNGHVSESTTAPPTAINSQKNAKVLPPPAKRSRSENNSENVSEKLWFPSNSKVIEVSSKLKPLLRDFVEHCGILKAWISLLIPKIEDGNNFGVSIQAEVVKEVSYYEDDAGKYYDELTEHFANRAKLCSKIFKYPSIEDYRNALNELDERQYAYLTRYVTAQLINSHALLHDLVTKNYEKIKRPKGSNSSSLSMY